MKKLQNYDEVDLLLREAVRKDPRLQRALEIFELSQDQYLKAVNSTVSTKFYTSSSSRKPPEGEENGELE